MKKWFITAKKADFTGIGEKFHITPMTARIIRNRDVVGDDAIRKYLHGDLSDLYSPWLLAGMKEGISLIAQSIEKKEKIMYANYISGSKDLFSGDLKGVHHEKNSLFPGSIPVVLAGDLCTG